MESKQPGSMNLNLQKLQRVFARRRRIFSRLFFSSLVVMILAAYLLPGEYETRTQLLVKVGQEVLTVTSMVMPGYSQSGSEIGDHVNSQIYILWSETLLRKVVDRVGADRILGTASFDGKPRSIFVRGVDRVVEGGRALLDGLGLVRRLSPQGRAFRKIEQHMRIQALPNSPVIEVRLVWGNPRLAAEILNTLVELYVAHSIEVQQPKGGFEFISAQVAEMNQAMTAANQKLTAFKQERGITSLPDQQRLLFEQIVQLRSQLQDTDAHIAETEGTIGATEKQLASLAKEVKLTQTEHKNPVYESLRLRESDLEVELANARARYTEESPVVASLVKQITVIRDRLNAEETLRLGDVTLGENTTYKTLETARQQNIVLLEGLKVRRKTLQEQIDTAMAKLSNLSGVETELSRLETESGITSKNYEDARDKYETVRTEKLMDQSKLLSVQVLEEARVPARPTRSRLMIMIIGVVGSLLVAGGGVLTAESLDHTLRDPSDVEQYLHLATLGVQPDRQAPLDSLQKPFKPAAGKPDAAGPDSAVAIKDLYQHLRSRLLMSMEGEQGKTILVTASVPREGGTTVASNLALALAGGQGHSCLLIEGNLRNPAVHGVYGLPKKPGLADLASGAIDPLSVVKPTSLANLSVVTSGEGYLDPLGIYVSSAWKDALLAWRNRFRWVVIDAAPIQPYVEGTLLASQVDEVVLVVEAGKSRRELVIETKERLEASGGKLLGVVLNRARQNF